MKESSEANDTITFGNRTSPKTRKIALAVILTVVVVGVSVALLAYFLTKKNDPEVMIQAGLVRGRHEGKALVFKGIPYAEPSVGKRRWHPSVPCEKNTCWREAFDAGEFGSICAQQDLLATTGNAENVIGSEDCLFVNVWTPNDRPQGKLLPVLVFIHGGFLLYLSGNWKGFHPSPEMVVDMNIVGVSFNYRLNAFGFLALQSLADDAHQNTSGNYGFMDQILALKWVRANIEKFGGDPNSVTLMGSSSGGTSVLALLASPSAGGLFHRAILMSASAVFKKSWEDAAKDNMIFLRNASCIRNTAEAERECLYQLSPRQIQDAIPWNEYPNWRMDDLLELPTKGRFAGAVAVVDKTIVSDPPLVAMATGTATDVPLIIGTTAQEIDIAPSVVFKETAFAEYRARVENRLGTFNFSTHNVSHVLDMYNQTLPDGSLPSIQLSYTSMVSDLRTTCPNNEVARIASQGLGSPVYRYVVTNRPSKPVDLFGFPSSFALHMWDLLAFFGFPSEVGYQPSEKDNKFMKDLRREFGEFINKGTVKEESWKEYPNKTALFGESEFQVQTDEYHKEQCNFWLDNGFFSYAWIN